MRVSGGRRVHITTEEQGQKCARMARHPRPHSNQARSRQHVRIQGGYHSPDGKSQAVRIRMKSGVLFPKRRKAMLGAYKHRPGSETNRSGVSSVYFEVIMATYNFNTRHAVSPQNPNGFGKAGTNATARITVSIPGYYSMDYTRIPISYTAQGTAWARTVGRY